MHAQLARIVRMNKLTYRLGVLVGITNNQPRSKAQHTNESGPYFSIHVYSIQYQPNKVNST